MKRREFIKKSLFATGGSLLIPSFLQGMEYLPASYTGGYKRLVIIQLSGGNDGLNTVIPYSSDLYYKFRKGIGIKEKKLLKLTDQAGLNPGLVGLRDLYEDGMLQVINSVGYPNPNRSHFRSMDIWHTASGSEQYLNSGWIGRYLDSHCNNAHEAIEVGDSLSLALKGSAKNGLAITDFRKLYNTTKEDFFAELTAEKQVKTDNPNLHYLYKTLVDTKNSSEYIFETAKTYSNKAKYPSTDIANQLKNVATFINSGLKTRVFYVSLSGFDTHVFQKGKHERTLKQYGDATKAFVDDLKKNNNLDETLILTFSEFGRRAKQNASQGTDHGTANNVFVIGSKLKKPGMFNPMADLADLDANGDLKYKIDFRDIYTSILNDWMNIDANQIVKHQGSSIKLV